MVCGGSSDCTLGVFCFFGILGGGRQSNLIAWKYGDWCSQRVIRRAAKDHINTNDDGFDLTGLCTRHSRILGISARLVAIGLVNFVALPVYLIVLVFLSPKMTLMIFCVRLSLLSAFIFSP